MKLNAKSIEAIKPTDRRVEYADHLVKGLRLIVQPTGIKTYQLRYRYNGQGKRSAMWGYSCNNQTSSIDTDYLTPFSPGHTESVHDVAFYVCSCKSFFI